MKKLLAVLALASLGAQAQTVNTPVLTTDTAIKLVSEGIGQCANDGYNVTVAVVDRSGALKALGRHENAGPHTLESARKKAFTSASMGVVTADLANNIADKPAISGLREMHPDILILGGGLPIRVNDQLVGGIGIGGAPGGHLDQACAEAALKAVLK
ncbi:heme-binding protein [Oceanimonas sp. CHS3-5]|uniref:GlcG/HbpS family heme-binding protein n=1 Tax=Oceanimonas sp. CHS3-5 TaxID=3068186 RepID=UPI00273FA9BC|nr:heme-binding protein [Oceanimonas sp. CHS3-5]MDP5290993.1 heme-binding protein [Oceanimonas sp. CHS3-5]